MRFLAIVLCAACAGCAWKSGVMRLGPDSYQTSANASPMRGASTGARKMALKAANAHCESMGRAIEVTGIEGGYAFPANGTATVTFRCK